MMKIFISYSHKDEKFKDELDGHLSPLIRTNEAITWNDRKIVAGKEWENEIDKNLETSDIIIFLVSSDFISSDYCYSIEAKRALQKHEDKTAILIPVIVRHCAWTKLPFSKIQGTPKDAKPISKWEDKDEAYLDVVNKISESIRFIQSTPTVSKERQGKSPISC